MTESDLLEGARRVEELMCTIPSDDESSMDGESDDSARGDAAVAAARPLSPRLGKTEFPARSRAATTGSLAQPRKSPPRRTGRSNSTSDEMESDMECGDVHRIRSATLRRTSLPLEVGSDSTPTRRSQSGLVNPSHLPATPVTPATSPSSSCFAFLRLVSSSRLVLSAGACLVFLSVFYDGSVATVMVSPMHSLVVRRRGPKTNTVSAIDGANSRDSRGQEVTFHGLAMEFSKDDDDGALSAVSSRDAASIESFELATPTEPDQNPSETMVESAASPERPPSVVVASQDVSSGTRKRRPRQPVLSYARSSSTSHPPRQFLDDVAAPSSPTTNKVRGEPYAHHPSMLGPSGKPKNKQLQEFRLDVEVADTAHAEFYPRYSSEEEAHAAEGPSVLFSTGVVCVWICVTIVLLDGFLREVIRRLSTRHQLISSPGRVLRYSLSSTPPWNSRRHGFGHGDAHTM